MKCNRYQEDQIMIDVCEHANQELYITATPRDPDASPAHLAERIYQQLVPLLSANPYHIVRENIFGTLASEPAILSARRRICGKAWEVESLPFTYIQGQPLKGNGLAGLQIQAVRLNHKEDRVWTISEHGHPLGRGWKLNGFQFLSLQNINGLADPTLPAAHQADCMLERIARILDSCGCTFHDVYRTWIFLANILAWYADFNRIRNAKYQQWELMPKSPDDSSGAPLRLPASTGIRGDNSSGAACVMDLLAVTGSPTERPCITQLTNTRQKDAFHYGAAFSRGALLQAKNRQLIHVSGTAAIDESGESLYPGDFTAQTARTFENIESLIAPAGACLHDVCTATVFLKDASDWATFETILKQRGLENMPMVCMVADVCREELLFEMDGIIGLV
jgi:enamine deaminase RidA (YjgF/YER057c/UK114 family)